MKKNIVLVVMIFCIVTSSLYASLNYKFDAFSLDPIYEEYFADRGRPDFSLSQINYYEGYPDRVLQDTHVRNNVENEVRKFTVFEFDGLIKPENKFVALKIGETIALARSTFTFDNDFLSPIAFDISMQALLQHFYRGSFDDNVSYDGIYFMGGTFRIGKVVSMRVGLHHYCSHYGDATLKRIDADIDSNFGQNPGDFGLTYKYVRMNDFSIGLSLDLTPNFRIYGELNMPRKDMSLRPDYFAPNWILRNGLPVNPDYPDSYQARIVNVGFEYSTLIFKNLGPTTIGYDLHLYEEGKIVYDHINGGEAHYEEDAPWELEHNAKIAQELDKYISLEVAYHNGRSVMNSFFFQHTSTLTVGLRFNPDYTVNVFDTSKN